MAGYSARQSTFTSGDTITAAHSNDEFNQLLAAFNASTGHTHDGTAGDGGPVTTLRDSDALNKILVDTSNNHLEFYVEVSSTATQQLRIQDGAIVPITDNDIDLGTSSLEFKDLFIDGTANVDALNLNGTLVTSTAAELNILDGVTSTAAELNILDGVTSTATEINILDGDNSASSVTIVDADRIILNDNGTMKQVAVSALNTYTSASVAADDLASGDAAINLTTSSGSITIDAAANDTDIIFKGTDNSSDITMLTLDGSEAGKATFNSDVVVGGDLTVTGDDIIMGTNTAGNLLIADGTNFNSIAVGSLSEISTVANDDVFLAVDTSGGGLKKIARSAVVSGLATSGAISNVVEDTSPQLGANLDTNSHNILIDDAHFIADENGNEQIIFQTTSSAVNQFDVTNAATGNPPQLSATGGDSNIDLNLLAKGTGHVTIVGNTNSGAIQFNCENNSHGQILKAQPHSASVTNELLLPAGGNSTLVSLESTDTLTNKTLTTPVIAEIDSGSTITLDATTDINLDADGGDIFFKDDGTTFGSATNTSGNLIIKSGTTTALTFSGADVTVAGDLTVSGDDITMGTNTDTAIMVADGTNFNPVVPSGDVTLTNAGVFGIASGVIVNADVNASAAIADSKLDTISTANKVSLAALDIDGGTDIGEAIVDADLFIVDNGAGGTNRKVAASRLVTYVDANSSAASVGKAIAMAIGVGEN